MAKILVVDDSKIMKKTIKNLLNNIGHIVIGEAGNGYEAIEMYKILYPDVVLMDSIMPNVNDVEDGTQAMKKILEYNPDAKIIMLSALSERKHILKAIQNGASHYVLKPLTEEKLKFAFNRLSL